MQIAASNGAVVHHWRLTYPGTSGSFAVRYIVGKSRPNRGSPGLVVVSAPARERVLEGILVGGVRKGRDAKRCQDILILFCYRVVTRVDKLEPEMNGERRNADFSPESESNSDREQRKGP